MSPWEKYFIMVEHNFTLFAQAEARAEFAERSVQKLQKEVDRLEGKNINFYFKQTILIYPLKKPKYYLLHANRNNQKNSRVNAIQNPFSKCLDIRCLCF